MSVIDLDECEKECEYVRKGDTTRINDLSEPFLEPRTFLFGMFRKKGDPNIMVTSLLASSESLLGGGHYRESVVPIQKLISRNDLSKDLKVVGLARAGQIAITHGLPMDLRPIVEELGLSRQDLQAALKNVRRRREKRSLLPEIERKLLQAMLLDERSQQVESETLGKDFLKGALNALEQALSLASDMEGNNYHLIRCMMHLGTFLMKHGDIPRGTEIMDVCLSRAEELGYVPILMEIYAVMGFYEEDLQVVSGILQKGRGIAERLENRSSLSELMFIEGNRVASESNDRDSIAKGIDMMIEAASIIETEEQMVIGASYRVEAALWSGRTGDPEKGLEQAKKALTVFRVEKDREQMIRVQCVIFLCLMKMDQRRKAKNLLLDLVMNEPVKQFPASFGIMKEAVSGVEWLRKDKDTRELFEDEIVYTIERVAVDEIIQRAREAYPNEFGAMLRGIPHITHIEPVMEGAGNRNSFLFSLYSRFSQRNVEGEGVVHSHPSGSARPSRADLSMFGRFPGINIIIGYPYKDDSMAAYDRLGNRVKLEIVDKRRG